MIDGYVRGEFNDPKSEGSARSVPMATRVAQELERLHQKSIWRADDDLVFAHPHLGTPLDGSKLLKRLKEAEERAGVRQVTFHELRHTFGTRMATAGVPLRTIQEWMGHTNTKTSAIYAHYSPALTKSRSSTRHSPTARRNLGSQPLEVEPTQSEHATTPSEGSREGAIAARCLESTLTPPAEPPAIGVRSARFTRRRQCRTSRAFRRSSASGYGTEGRRFESSRAR